MLKFFVLLAAMFIVHSRLFCAYEFFDMKLSKPLFILLETGFEGSDDKPVEIAEKSPLDMAWNVSGSMIFISSDKTDGSYYHGIRSEFPGSVSSTDWSEIRFKIRSTWKDRDGKIYTEDILEGDFNDPSVRKEENDDFCDDDNPYVRDYKFSIILNKINYQFNMPLAPETYVLGVEISYPVAVWQKKEGVMKMVNVGRMTSKSKDREILVKDLTPPVILLDHGLETTGEHCTSGDPLPDSAADVRITLQDNNPNADIEDVIFESMGKKYVFSQVDVKRDYSAAAETRFTGTYQLNIPNREGDILAAPEDAAPLNYSITAADQSGNSTEKKSSMQTVDNDPPNIKFIFNNISAVIKKENYDPVGSKGKMDIDMLDLDTRKVLYVDEFVSPDPLPVVLKTDQIIVKQNTRIFFQAFAFDNSDQTPLITLNGQRISEEGKRFIFTDSTKTDTSLEAQDKAGNKRKVIVPIKVQKMYFNTQTIEQDK